MSGNENAYAVPGFACNDARRTRAAVLDMTRSSPPQFPEHGILWRGWNDETLRLIQEKGFPVLIFIADPHAFEWPLLKAVFKEMPTNARLCELLHEFCPALFLRADELPDDLTMLGAGSRYHIAVLSPYGLTPMVRFNPASGSTPNIVNEIVQILERLIEAWG